VLKISSGQEKHFLGFARTWRQRGQHVWLKALGLDLEFERSFSLSGAAHGPADYRVQEKWIF
jgi:hypothetical protein